MKEKKEEKWNKNGRKKEVKEYLSVFIFMCVPNCRHTDKSVNIKRGLKNIMEKEIIIIQCMMRQDTYMK